MISFLSSKEKWDSPEILDAWQNLQKNNDNINSLYQTPQWFEHLIKVEKNSRLLLALVKSEDEQVSGIIPIRVGQYSLKFDIASKTYWTRKLQSAYILGSTLLINENDFLYDDFFSSISKYLYECDSIYFDSIQTESYIWKYLNSSNVIKKDFMIYVPDGIRKSFFINLPDTYEKYISNLSYNNRRKIRKSLKKINEYCNEDITLKRIESDDQIETFLKEATIISKNSWQYKRIGSRIDQSSQRKKKLIHLAKSQLLCSYILLCNKTPISFLLGYIFENTYYAIETGYDQKMSMYSPGIVILSLIIEDLITNDIAKKYNFGVGDAIYKNRLSNNYYNDASVILFKKSFLNRITKTSHKTFRNFIHLGRKFIKDE